MEKITIRMRVLRVFSSEMHLEVNFYTDEQLEVAEVKRAARTEQLLREATDQRNAEVHRQSVARDISMDEAGALVPAARTLDDFRAQAEREYMPGTLQGVDLPLDLDLNGPALVEHIMAQAPRVWLERQTQLLRNPQDISHLERMCTGVYSLELEPVVSAPAIGAIPVEKI